jgi:hypothetical protein
MSQPASRRSHRPARDSSHAARTLQHRPRRAAPPFGTLPAAWSLTAGGVQIGVICAPVASLLGVGLEPSERPRGAGCSLARAGQIIYSGLFKGLAAGPGGAAQPSGVIRGRPGLILLSVQAGRLPIHRSVLFLAVGRWGRLAYPAGWSRWVSAVWRRPAPGVRTAWASARRDPARMMSFLARVTPV